jgi:hypothetical protein
VAGVVVWLLVSGDDGGESAPSPPIGRPVAMSEPGLRALLADEADHARPDVLASEPDPTVEARRAPGAWVLHGPRDRGR